MYRLFSPHILDEETEVMQVCQLPQTAKSLKLQFHAFFQDRFVTN